LSIIQEVERRILDALILLCAAEHEVSFATVEPRHRIACTVKFGKFNLVDGVRGVIAVDVRVSIYTASPRVVQGTSMGTIRADREKFVVLLVLQLPPPGRRRPWYSASPGIERRR
jgi:hypothetical protein